MASIFQQKQPLPTNPYDPSTQAAFYHAYAQCLAMQNAAGSNANDLHLVYARCLGYLILELPHAASLVVAKQVVSCDSDVGKINELCEMYINHLFRRFRRKTGGTPPSSSSDPPSRDEFRHDTVRTPIDHQTAKRMALIRDNYRCVVTGYPDKNAYRSMLPEEQDRHFGPPNNAGGFVMTSFCHIIPPSMMMMDWRLWSSLGTHENEGLHTGGIMDVIAAFGSIDDDVLNDLNGNSIHNIRNGMTMTQELRSEFDDLDLWFEEIPGQPHSYRVQTRLTHAILLPFGPNHVVTFTTTDENRLPLPDPGYLRLHATVCRVAHLSGLSGYLNSEDEREEMHLFLARDGSSAGLLAGRLGCLSVGS